MYEPTAEERAWGQRIVDQLTPTQEEYERYASLAEQYRSLMSPALRTPRAGREIRGLGWRTSRLFGGRRYLAAFVDDAWAGHVAPDCDAFASPGLERVDGERPLISMPPLVMVPWASRRLRNRSFLSVVEHEIVHVNQAIRGEFPAGPLGLGLDGLCDEYRSRVRVEFQANFAQLARWPDHFPGEHGLSLEHWCALRGHTTALERLLLSLDDWQGEAGDLLDFLEAFPDHMSSVFAELGISESVAEWFRSRVLQHLLRAAQLVVGWRPAVRDLAEFQVVVRWLANQAD